MPTHSHSTMPEQPQPPHPAFNGGKSHPRRNSVLGVSKKMVTSTSRKVVKATNATVRLPLRTVGRFVNRSRVSSDGQQEGEPLMTDSNYGTLVLDEDADPESCSSAPSSVSILEDVAIRATSMTHRSASQRSLATLPSSADASSNWAVDSMERWMRQILFIMGAYICGAKRPEFEAMVAKVAEYVVTAWGTCAFILTLAFLQKHYPQLLRSAIGNAADTASATATANATTTTATTERRRSASVQERQLLDAIPGSAQEREREPLVRGRKPTSRTAQQLPAQNEAPSSAGDDLEAPVQVAGKNLTSTSTSFDDRSVELSDAQCPHPSLAPYFVMNSYTGERITPNTSEPFHLSTEWFEMDMMAMIRTPDLDDPSLTPGTPANVKAMEYMKGKQRRFEFQYQLQLKKVPTGKQIYFACELEEPIKMGIIQRAFVGAAMAFVKTTNQHFHYSIQGSKKTPDGKYEKPHMSFLVEDGLNRLVVTKPDETLPKLGGVINEDPESMKRRKKGIPIDWNTKDTYTMALWSAYVDFLDWRVLNLPGIRPFSLASVLGSQCINFTMYFIDDNRGNDKHYQKDIENVVNLEMSNQSVAALGPVATPWAAQNKRQPAPAVSHESQTRNMKLQKDLSQQTMQLHESLSKELYNDDQEDDDKDAATAAELGEGIYLRSGDSVVFREFILDCDDNSSPCSMANGGGFCVLQNRDCTVLIEKAKGAKRNRLIKTGDTVLFKLIQKKGEGETETRYLSIHRGWWLKWVSSMPSKNGFFTIYTHDSEVNNQDEKGIRSGETQSSYLTLGGSFVLRHKRWSNYNVGVAQEPSATYGGRMLGLYIPESLKGGHAGDEQYHSDEGEDMDDQLDIGVSNKAQGLWMKPLLLCAHEPGSLLAARDALIPKPLLDNPSTSPEDIIVNAPAAIMSPKKLMFSREHCQIDVPAWIEMMNRTERVRQLTYVVRITDKNSSEESLPPVSPTESDDSANGGGGSMMVRLRTGRELAQIMRVGQSMRNLSTSDMGGSETKRSTKRSASNERFPTQHGGRINVTRNSFAEGTLTPPQKRDGILSLSPRHLPSPSAFVPVGLSFENNPLADEDEEESEMESEAESEVESEDPEEEWDDPVLSDVSDEESEEEVQEEGSVQEGVHGVPEKYHGAAGAVKKGRSLIGKVAKTAKTATMKTGKTAVKTVVGTGKLTGKVAVGTGKLTGKVVVGSGKVAVGTGKIAVRQSRKVAKGTISQSKKVAKGTVNAGKAAAKGTVNAGKALTVTAGKAVIAPLSGKSKKPPKQEPKAKQASKERRRQERELHVEVSKTMKMIEKIEQKTFRAPNVLAGELCAPEQSCRTASRVLSRMSNLPPTSPLWKRFNDVLYEQINPETDQDGWFLEGSSVQIGVQPLSGDKSRGVQLHESLVARCLWESHWREEWCGMYDSCVSFYAPLSDSPCLEIAYVDITNVRPLDAGYLTPLPGYPLLVLETAWLCHYIAFREEEARDTFGEKVEAAIVKHIRQVEESASIEERDLRKARFWQGFQGLSEASVSSGRGKWAKVSSSQKTKHRTILNSRRMLFDLKSDSDLSNGYAFVEELFTTALSFSLGSLEDDPESFVEFLDATSQLRLLPLQEIDSSSRHAFCLFVNLYHCLLQHAMLLSVNGPLNKKSVGHFMRTTCYEIGGDVFSLAEIHSCIIRGKMSKPVSPKPPYIEAPKKSSSYRFYALDYTDPRVNFVLNTGDIACPATVPVLRPNEVEKQLNAAAASFLKKELYIDVTRRIVVLPKVCEIYRNDFGDASISCLRFCLGGLDEGVAGSVRVMMMDEATLVIRYQHTAEQYLTYLRRREDGAAPLTPVMDEVCKSTDG